MTTKNETLIKAEPGKQELFIIREFDAPRELVFKAFVDPKLVVKWLGPRDLTMKIKKFDTKSGGSWEYVHSRNGNDYHFHGVFHEVTAPERIIQTFEFDGLPEKGRVVLQTVILEELPGGRTRMTNQGVYLSVADRDGMLQSGMKKGVDDSYDRLDTLFDRGEIK